MEYTERRLLTTEHTEYTERVFGFFFRVFSVFRGLFLSFVMLLVTCVVSLRKTFVNHGTHGIHRKSFRVFFRVVRVFRGLCLSFEMLSLKKQEVFPASPQPTANKRLRLVFQDSRGRCAHRPLCFSVESGCYWITNWARRFLAQDTSS